MNGVETLTKVPGYLFATTKKGIHSYSANGARQFFGVPEELPVTVNTKFDLASLTKIVGTTASLLHLVELGELQVTDLACKYLEPWQGTDKSEITIAELLSHQSGLAEWRPLYFTDNLQENVAKQISRIPLTYPRNSGRRYSDLGFISLGEIVKAITGKDLPIAFAELVFNPLGMHNTSFGPITGEVVATSNGDWYEKNMVTTNTPYQIDHDVSEFAGWRDSYLIGEVNDGNSYHRLNGVAGHAGLFSTAEDLLIYAEAVIDNKWQAHNFLNVSGDPMQGLGFRNWRIPTNSGEQFFWGHTGFTGVALGIAPARQSAALLLTNRLHAQGEPVATEELWQPFLMDFCAQIVI
jgi:serine-type D-Ala-D-Ala carboxypeptidase|uniref:serine hydrolase domain-containing protein n=3 Tax=Candidatus Planktophila sp. TaxID=2175601 RepID=UPI00404ADEDD